MKRFFLFVVLLLPSIAQADSITFYNDTDNTFKILTPTKGSTELAPNAWYSADIGAWNDTIRHLQSGNQIIETTLLRPGLCGISVVDANNTDAALWTKSWFFDGNFAGYWLITKDKDGNLSVENAMSLFDQLESSLARRAAKDMFKHKDDDEFAKTWYAPGSQGYNNLLELSANDRQLLLKVAKLLAPNSSRGQIIKVLETLAPSVIFINNTPNSLANLTQGGELAPGERYIAKVGKGTTNHLKSPPPLNQVVQTTSTRTSDGSFITTVAVVREDGTIVSSARVPGNVGKWSVKIDPYKGNYVVENSQSLIGQLDSDLAKQAANDMLKHLYDGAFEGYWYAPGNVGYNNLKGVSRKDRQTLLEIATLLPTGSHGPQIRELIASIA